MTDQPIPRAPIRHRTTDSAMEVPTAGRAFMMLRRLARLKCPNCGGGAVLTRRFGVHRRCSACGFRYERSDENYFAGAMFVNFMLGGATFAISFLAVLLTTWPNVPWNALTFGAPVVMLVLMVLFYPVSKVVWLTADVMLRPVTPGELD
jgi:uncharacterized protein (DUF983 family)